jgi:radical SAM superfamily enzyme YgiQ (UPF0313 family)
MKIALVYPPPWKIPELGEASDTWGDGPPKGFKPTDIDADFFQMPYGMFTLGAAALQAGHQVKVVNLSAFPWARVEQALETLDADVYGMSCYTANRRGVGIVAKAIKRLRPRAHVIVGGPHVTALPKETLSFVEDIDSVAIGEGEATFLELLERLSEQRTLDGMSGLAYRSNGNIVVGPRRDRIRELDSLPSPHRHYRTHLFMTSRGCPGECTFCAKNTTWGRIYRTHSVDYVLDGLEAALSRLPVKMILVKDDTFTADRKRAIRICEGIRERKINFLWSCDTRADVLNEDVLRAMRLAGCQRLSFGVESASPKILRNIRKKMKPQEVLHATKMAKKFGMQVRYFMMLGNRGETAATFKESLDFVRAAQPHQALFACLSIYPGTNDFQVMERNGWIDREVYFTEDFQELKVPFDASERDTQLMSDWFDQNMGIRHLHQPTVEECKRVLEELGELHTAHLDLAGAHYREGALDDAEVHVNRALELDYPAPGLAYNYLACIAADRGDYEAMQQRFNQAAVDPQHPVLVRNVQVARKWVREGGQASGVPLSLAARHDFELLERTEQPTLPGPLDPDFASW